LKFGVKKADKDSVEKALGVVSTQPGKIIGENINPNFVNSDGTDKESKEVESRPILIALAGRVPVKVDPDSEDISYGDYLSVSEKTGMVKKADSSGLVLGKALEEWDNGIDEESTNDLTSDETVVDLNGMEVTASQNPQEKETNEKPEPNKITILVQNTWYEPAKYRMELDKLLSDYRSGALGGSGGLDSTGWLFEGDSIATSADVIASSLVSTTGTFSVLDAQNLNIGEDKFVVDSQGHLDIAGDLVLAGTISGRYGDVRVRLGDSQGNDKFIIANSNKEEVFSVDSKGGVSVIDGQDASTGYGLISVGSRSAVIRTSRVGTKPKIYVTFNDDYSPATRYWVTDINEGSSFRVQLDAEPNRDVEFNWWIVNGVE
jgi:hypothetical protein